MERKRILFVTHRLPYPPNRGDKIRSFHILLHLLERHEVHVACPIDDAADLAGLRAIEALVAGISWVKIDGRSKALSALAAACHLQSVSVRYFYSRVLQKKIDRVIDENDFDAVYCFSSPTAEYLFKSRHRNGKLRRATKLMDLIDIDSFKWAQYARRSPWWRAWIFRYESHRLSAYERRIAAFFFRLFVVSERERCFFPGEHSHDRLVAIQNGVDLQVFHPGYAPSLILQGPVLVFTGVMDYWPNVEGVLWFAQNIIPRIKAAVPDAHFYVVGTRPTPSIRALDGRDGIVVTGFVEDVREYLSCARVCVAPLRIARGVQNKILEAMAMGRPVVCTPDALEGIDAIPGQEILVATDEQSFADAVIGMLLEPARAARIGRAARLCVEDKYCWEKNLGALDRTLAMGAAV